MGWSREHLYRSSKVKVDASGTERFEALMARRAGGEPVAYLTGKREFWSQEFRVTPEVLIPRPETEHLVEAVVDFLASRTGLQRALDLGTGSGAIAVSVAKECTRAEVWATDVSTGGAARWRGRTRAGTKWVTGSAGFRATCSLRCKAWRSPLTRWYATRPTSPSREMTRLAAVMSREWEPTLALDGGADGMVFYRRIVREGTPRLREGGLLAVEIGADLGRPGLGVVSRSR